MLTFLCFQICKYAVFYLKIDQILYAVSVPDLQPARAQGQLDNNRVKCTSALEKLNSNKCVNVKKLHGFRINLSTLARILVSGVKVGNMDSKQQEITITVDLARTLASVTF